MILFGNRQQPLAVQIGSQVWRMKNYDESGTPMGNVIANVTGNADWANATALYDDVYAATSGDAATKEYAALKAAAMWCYYNNSEANGRIYGKLYNWYAAKLFDLDMVASGFGWRVPTSAQITTLANALGSASVAGGKLKMTGTDYWNTPNTGATNESGFTFLAAGNRTSLGAFATNLSTGYILTRDSATATTTPIYFIFNTSFNLQTANLDKLRGFSLRLIKTP